MTVLERSPEAIACCFARDNGIPNCNRWANVRMRLGGESVLITYLNNLRRTYNFMPSSLVVVSEMGNAAGSMISARRNGRLYSIARGGVT